jgi:hypothetical protein
MNTFALPPLYRRWVDQILNQDVYSEPRATCDNCPMCKQMNPPAKQDYQFNVITKCCAFNPSLPNYLVGAILADDDPGLNKAKEQFLNLVGHYSFTPLEIAPPFSTTFAFKIRPFATDKDLQCPFYLYDSGGLCGIWKYRNATCSTYFCKHERGVIGFRFWRKLEQTLLAAEKKLALHCAMKLNVIIPENASDLRERTWGNWIFREAEFYINCWNIVHQLQWEEVLRIGGAELEFLVKDLKSLFHNLQSTALPQILKIKKFKSEQVSESMTRLWSYSFSDPIDLPTEIVQVLEHFDGRPTSEVLDQIKNETAITIDNDVLQKLSDYDILLPVKT